MRNQLLAAAVAVVLGGGSVAPGLARAASDDELAQIRAQLHSLIERVDRLESQNAALEAENDRLKSQAAPATVQQLASRSAEPGKQTPPAVTAADWPNRISVKGDLRYRHQQTDSESASAKREQDLLRARLVLEGTVNEALVVGVGVTTSSAPGSPRGGNQLLDGEFSRKPLYFDLAFFDWQFAGNAHLIGGKMRMPFFRAGQSLFWDGDITPEGVAATYRAGSLFGSAWSFWIDENVPAGTATAPATSSDAKMFGIQVGNRFDVGFGELVIAGMYYDLAAAEGRRPFFNGGANGNSLTSTGGFAYDYQVIGLMAELDTRLGGLPLRVWADAAQNRDAVLDTAYALGVVLGKASRPGSWEAGVAYQLVEKDALFAQHIDSDFVGLTDAGGWALRAAYAPMKNWVLNAGYYMASANRDVGMPYDFDRLMLDFNVKY